MRQFRDERRHAGMMNFNATPLVDVIFTLTIFFSLVARFSSAEHVRLELPGPVDSQARIVAVGERVTINCRLGDALAQDGPTVLYSIGPNRPEPLWVIADRLAAIQRRAPGISVILRADRRLSYADVRPVMDMIADLGIKMLNVVAHMADER